MPSARFMQALPFVLRWEGGYVNHPADPGGATNKGVTQKVYSTWLARRGRPDADVRGLADAEMADIYEEGYWGPARCEELPALLDQVQFDTAVNMGVGRAVRFLQEAVGAAVDGGFGPGTRESVRQANPAAALVRYLDIRERFYRRLVDSNPSLGVFLQGWLNRLTALRSLVSGPQASDAGGAFEDMRTARIPDDEAAPQDVDARLSEQARALTQALAGAADEALCAQVVPVLLQLRSRRDWAGMCALAEALLRVDPDPPTVWRLYAQALIEDGALVPAAALLRPLAARLDARHPEFGEAWGLLGRVHKQRFADMAPALKALRRQALGDAMAAYAVPYRIDPALHTWHGVNLLATVARARREGWKELGARWNLVRLARQLRKALHAKPWDEWTPGTLAEVALAESLVGGDLGVVEQALQAHLAAEGTQAFHVASTLRQFTEIWQLEQITPESPGHALRTPAAVQRAHALLEMLRSRLLSLH